MFLSAMFMMHSLHLLLESFFFLNINALYVCDGETCSLMRCKLEELLEKQIKSLKIFGAFLGDRFNGPPH